MRAALLALSLAMVAAPLAACANEYHPEYHPETATTYEQNISYPTTTVFTVSSAVPGDLAGVANEQGDAASRVLVLQSTHLDRPAEVVGVVDAHVPMGSHDRALDVLRRRAVAMGADAVVGVEFHHGEGEGQPTHLSGLAVRFLPSVPYRVDR
jgi:hypothetical protein